jgi:hypothetical protein
MSRLAACCGVVGWEGDGRLPQLSDPCLFVARHGTQLALSYKQHNRASLSCFRPAGEKSESLQRPTCQRLSMSPAGCNACHASLGRWRPPARPVREAPDYDLLPERPRDQYPPPRAAPMACKDLLPSPRCCSAYSTPLFAASRGPPGPGREAPDWGFPRAPEARYAPYHGHLVG